MFIVCYLNKNKNMEFEQFKDIDDVWRFLLGKKLSPLNSNIMITEGRLLSGVEVYSKMKSTEEYKTMKIS